MARFTLFDKLGEPLKVRLDLRAIEDAEARLGIGLNRAIADQLGPRFYSIILWAGCKWDNRELTTNDITGRMQKAIRAKKCTMLDIQNFVLRALADSEAFSGFQLEDEDDEEEKKERNPTKP